MNGSVDLYCERTDPGLFAEPLNAASNLAFFAAGLIALHGRRATGHPTVGDRLLIGLTLAIGAGSLAFHTLANRAGLIADVLPILLFQVTFLQQHATRVLGLTRRGVVALFALFVGLIIAFGALPPNLFNGSLAYAPALCMVGFLATLERRRDPRAARTLLAATGLFLVSLSLRSMDMAVCRSWPLGTHAFWHLANGGVLYLCMRSLWPTTDKKKPGQAPA